MKIYKNGRYIKSSTDEKTLEFVIDFCFDFDERIEAAFNPMMTESELDDAIDEMAEEQYSAFISMMVMRFRKIGFEILEGPKFSNQKNSKSCYLTVCNKDDYDTLTVKVILNIRISDHRLTKRNGNNKNWDRYAARADYYNRELENYKDLNAENPDDMYYVLSELYVSGNKFKTYRDAMRYIEKQIKETMDRNK